MLGLYAAVVWATRFTLAPMADGWRLPRRVRVVVAVVAMMLVSVPLVIGGIH